MSLLGLPLEYIHFLESELEHAGDDNPISTLALRLFLGERCLRDTDAMSMAVSLEVRTAFTDHGFVETALGIDKERRCRRVPDKRFQWDAFRPYLGPDYPLHGKQGFIFPFEEWLRDKRTLENLQEVLMNRRLLADIGIDPEGVKHLLLAFLRGRPRIPWSRVWAVFVFARWCEQNRVFL